MPPKKETLEIGMTSFRLFLWKSKNEWLVWSLAKTVPPPQWTLPTSRPFWAVNCANEQLWSRAEIVPMFRHNSSVKWTILSSHRSPTYDWYVHKNRRSKLTQPNNSHELFHHFYFELMKCFNEGRFSFYHKSPFLGSLPTWKPFSAIVCLPLAHAKYLLESSRRVSNVEKCTNSRKA